MQEDASIANTYPSTMTGLNNRTAKSKAERMKNFRENGKDIGKTLKNIPPSQFK
jgi:hypothetical protein